MRSQLGFRANRPLTQAQEEAVGRALEITRSIVQPIQQETERADHQESGPVFIDAFPQLLAAAVMQAFGLHVGKNLLDTMHMFGRAIHFTGTEAMEKKEAGNPMTQDQMDARQTQVFEELRKIARAVDQAAREMQEEENARTQAPPTAKH